MGRDDFAELAKKIEPFSEIDDTFWFNSKN
jgi:hypothetical protein